MKQIKIEYTTMFNNEITKKILVINERSIIKYQFKDEVIDNYEYDTYILKLNDGQHYKVIGQEFSCTYEEYNKHKYDALASSSVTLEKMNPITLLFKKKIEV